jgi:hypothetical protein
MAVGAVAGCHGDVAGTPACGGAEPGPTGDADLAAATVWLMIVAGPAGREARRPSLFFAQGNRLSSAPCLSSADRFSAAGDWAENCGIDGGWSSVFGPALPRAGSVGGVGPLSEMLGRAAAVEASAGASLTAVAIAVAEAATALPASPG